MLSLFAGTTRVARSGVAGFLAAVARDRPGSSVRL
jgi:hypothetical protein